MNTRAITPRATDYSQWYLDVIAAAELSCNSPVRGCMVIKPNGYAIWENIQRVLNGMFREKNVQNAYFPLFIPISFLEREAEHVAGFAKECAVVTHHRLQLENGKLVPASPLEEPLIIRPTSETIMYSTFADWIKSHRDLPLLINQWANIVRWEMRTRPFLRTTEFLWQEGHTAHATNDEASDFTLQMLEVYRRFVEDYLAIPVICGKKSESEKFAGAVFTTCIEAMMQDGKALQAGTSHLLGQNFAKAFNVKFLNSAGAEEFVHQTSWGLSTRIIGALVMVHADDKGMVIPPKIASVKVAILPVWNNADSKQSVMTKAEELARNLNDAGIETVIDRQEGRLGPKSFEWEKKGVPVRIEIGPRDLANDTAVVVRRDTGEKAHKNFAEIAPFVNGLLDEIQKNLFTRAKKYRDERTFSVDSWEEFQRVLEENGGFITAHWCGSADCETQISEKTKATIRCLPFGQPKEEGQCVFCGKKSESRVIFAKAY
ncbi:MAG: proline--tRNA ligase [Candidatus Kerfeldbacteria bacterium CG_4_10_14_0_8_um_filter_42_10]|uniref:Proline--tRNA ligase n=1 Tax=Candidatus Kerfeldbacteria bacterium CG_4_10_14_0_8_um_filter_42_10 TaxID=2014248 RepID=A0A2M7RFF3_9BACT|nr:MAG: proline--tRNA ligase [Candidatus Kerfeldbacteria bacterium CG_4_10_14_0_8_um_filter_42_10]